MPDNFDQLVAALEQNREVRLARRENDLRRQVAELLEERCEELGVRFASLPVR